MLIRANGPTNLGANRSNPGLPTGRRRDAAGERGRALGHPVARRIEMALGGRFCPTLTWVERWPDPPLRQKILFNGIWRRVQESNLPDPKVSPR